MNISAWKGRRVSTGGKNVKMLLLKSPKGSVTRDVVLSFTFIHVLGEAVEDSCCGRHVEELHWAAKDLVKELIMQLRGGTQSSLQDTTRPRFNTAHH